MRRLKSPAQRVTIGVVGKYIELQDAYKSVYESITHGGIANDCAVEVEAHRRRGTRERTRRMRLRGLDGILVPGGFGDRGTEGKIAAARFARESGMPYFGLCLGLQIAVDRICAPRPGARRGQQRGVRRAHARIPSST